MDEKIKTELEKIHNKIFRATSHIKTTSLLMLKAQIHDEIGEEELFNCINLFETEAKQISEQNEIIANIFEGRF